MSLVLATKFSIVGLLWLRYSSSKIAKIVFFGVVLVFTKTFALGTVYPCTWGKRQVHSQAVSCWNKGAVYAGWSGNSSGVGSSKLVEDS